MSELNLGTARICLEHEYGLYTLDFFGRNTQGTIYNIEWLQLKNFAFELEALVEEDVSEYRKTQLGDGAEAVVRKLYFDGYSLEFRFWDNSLTEILDGDRAVKALINFLKEETSER
ncbi:hypothetical protein [Corynebacterium pyruviciproducens]|uniref:Uncharacterized protein n=1 Tax=Corynebacterium pyruviciproducens TaxID=598660 RepID=A0AAF1BXF8_9CORY|nr:hypothetical protein [Corynebacterium pyruviciproducens]WOT03412.1 hypothetical protein CYJ47_06570 [Corynebacterium pyruviciproducens]